MVTRACVRRGLAAPLPRRPSAHRTGDRPAPGYAGPGSNDTPAAMACWQRPVETIAPDCAPQWPMDTARTQNAVAPRSTGVTGHDHPGDPYATTFAGQKPEPPQRRHRARIDGVAAQFGTGKGGAIDQPDTRPRAGENRRSHGAGGSCADDQDVDHALTRPITMALFFDPKPRQLQSAASTRASRPWLGR